MSKLNIHLTEVTLRHPNSKIQNTSGFVFLFASLRLFQSRVFLRIERKRNNRNSVATLRHRDINRKMIWFTRNSSGKIWVCSIKWNIASTCWRLSAGSWYPRSLFLSSSTKSSSTATNSTWKRRKTISVRGKKASNLSS